MGEQQGQGKRSFADIVDLDEKTHITRCRKDVTQRAKDLAFSFRMFRIFCGSVRWASGGLGGVQATAGTVVSKLLETLYRTGTLKGL